MAKKKTPPKRKKKTIAQKTTARKRFWTPDLLRWLAMIPLAGIWYIFTFLMAGYSFSALVCICLIGILLFYNVCSRTKKRFPKSTKAVKTVFTILLCFGLLVVGITECLIIHASFGDKDETCEYMLVLGAKVRNDGPSVSLMDRIRAAAVQANWCFAPSSSRIRWPLPIPSPSPWAIWWILPQPWSTPPVTMW